MTCTAQFAGASQRWFGNLFGSTGMNGTANLKSDVDFGRPLVVQAVLCTLKPSCTLAVHVNGYAFEVQYCGNT